MSLGLTVEQRVSAIFERLKKAARRANRHPNEITLLGASKQRSGPEIQAAAHAGVACFGENYVADLVDKATAMPQLEWHFIGHLQRNKAKRLAPHIALMHSLDNERLADTLNACADALPLLIQVNVGGEETKTGCSVQEAPTLAQHVLSQCPNLLLQGLMCIPPPDVDPTPFYRTLATLRNALEQRLGMALPTLSMGMSADLEQAIHCGATIVRVGTDIFGPRTPA
jgi:pyridoxal phosphate enzyme (YggS family)